MARLVALLALSPACGPDAALWLRVEAPLVVPDECDALAVKVELADPRQSLFEHTYDLASGPEFPLTLSLTTDKTSRLDRDLEVTVTALKDGELAAPWAQAAETTRLGEGRVDEVVIQLCDCDERP